MLNSRLKCGPTIFTVNAVVSEKAVQMAVSRICQVKMGIISQFPKPQVVGPIPTEGAS